MCVMIRVKIFFLEYSTRIRLLGDDIKLEDL